MSKNCVHIHSALSAGLMHYTKGWAWQHCFLNNRLEYQRSKVESSAISVGQESDVLFPNHDRILLIEHHPVYTLGRGADEANLSFLKNDENSKSLKSRLSKSNRGSDSARLLMDRFHDQSNYLSIAEEVQRFVPPRPVMTPSGTPIYRVERGGEVTFHGPGMLVVYPLIDLKREPYKQDLHWYLRCIEEVIIRSLETYDIASVRDNINTGVWVGSNKIAAVGVSSSRWITTHGFALNVNPDLGYFDPSIIIPCGIVDRGVTSIASELKAAGRCSLPSIQQVATTIVKSFEEVFGVSTSVATEIE